MISHAILALLYCGDPYDETEGQKKKRIWYKKKRGGDENGKRFLERTRANADDRRGWKRRKRPVHEKIPSRLKAK